MKANITISRRVFTGINQNQEWIKSSLKEILNMELTLDDNFGKESRVFVGKRKTFVYLSGQDAKKYTQKKKSGYIQQVRVKESFASVRGSYIPTARYKDFSELECRA